MEALKRARQVGSNGGDDGSPTKRTGASNLLGTNMGNSNSAFVEGSPVDILLFGSKKSNSAFSSSMGMTASSDGNLTPAIVVNGLKNIIKVCNITPFAISTSATDGSRLYTVEKIKAAGGNGKVPIETLLSTKIQVMLD
jgi:hypothetical protein